MTPSTKLLAAALLGSILASPACGPTAAGSEHEQGSPLVHEARRREKTRVQTAPVERREMVRTLSTTSVVESDKEIEIFPRITGVVSTLACEEGDVVQEGQVLASLDAREMNSALEQARIAEREAGEAKAGLVIAAKEAVEAVESARLAWEQAKRDVARNEKSGFLSDSELDTKRLTRDTNERSFKSSQLGLEKARVNEANAQTAIDKARLATKKAELDLSYTNITAPFSGVIATRSIKVGDTASSSAAAFVLTDPENLRAVIYRPQRELQMFRAAQDTDSASAGPRAGSIEIQVGADALPGELYDGEIILISPTIDRESGSFRVTIGLTQPEQASGRPRLLPGMLVRMEVVTDRHADALVVPKRALRREGDTSFLFAVRDGAARRVEIEESFADDEFVEVIPRVASSLVEGDSVIVVGNRDLEDGVEVDEERWGSQREVGPELDSDSDSDSDEAEAELKDAEVASEDGEVTETSAPGEGS